MPLILAHQPGRSRERATHPSPGYRDPVLIRPMRHEDVPAAERVSSESFSSLLAATRTADRSEPAWRGGKDAAAWQRRCHHLVDSDAGGCWVAEEGSQVVGIATSMRRETWWGLSSLFVAVGFQGNGIGAGLLDAALLHSRGAVRGLICSTHDPRAVRRYHSAGFTIHPAMAGSGCVDRSLLPVVDHVREASASDFDLCDSVDRQTRGAAHGVDHPVMLEQHPMVVVDDTTGSGYCYLNTDGGPYLLAASNRRTAQRLLWESLAMSTPDTPVAVRNLTGEQDWAVDVLMAARLPLHNRGYLAYRFMKPAAPYLPSPHFM
jgi:GNAT superfamily N-acetyltransferase